MTSDSTPPEPTENAAQNAMADAKAAFQNAGFTTPEGMVALGSLVVLGVWLVFHLMMRDFTVGIVAQLLAVVAALLYFGRNTWTAKIAPRPVLLKAIGYVFGIMAVLDVIWILRTVQHFRGVVIVAWLLLLGGFVIAFLGARAIKVE